MVVVLVVACSVADYQKAVERCNTRMAALALDWDTTRLSSDSDSDGDGDGVN